MILKLAGGEEAEARVFPRCSQKIFKPIRFGVGIGIEQNKPASLRQTRPNVVGRRKAEIGGQMLESQGKIKLDCFQQIQGIIGGAIIHDDDFEVPEGPMG